VRNARGYGIARRLALGALAGAVGTAAMDVVLYGRYRREGGQDGAWRWESAEGVASWDQASAPGQVGKKVEQLVMRRPPPERWARSTTNVVHWATGAGWGVQYAAVAGRLPRRPWLWASTLGPAAWLSGYAVLPVAGVYKPIWKYDARILGKDLSAHLVYGAVTSAAFGVLGGFSQSAIQEER
jgi:hypothetical protein